MFKEGQHITMRRRFHAVDVPDNVFVFANGTQGTITWVGRSGLTREICVEVTFTDGRKFTTTESILKTFTEKLQ